MSKNTNLMNIHVEILVAIEMRTPGLGSVNVANKWTDAKRR